jgi:HNH endonuclease
MGAVIDHIQAHSRGGVANQDNFATSCNKCNTRKGNALAEAFTEGSPLHPVKGKYGEPQTWDGLSQLFIVLAEQTAELSSASEREWLKALAAATHL